MPMRMQLCSRLRTHVDSRNMVGLGVTTPCLPVFLISRQKVNAVKGATWVLFHNIADP